MHLGKEELRQGELPTLLNQLYREEQLGSEPVDILERYRTSIDDSAVNEYISNQLSPLVPLAVPGIVDGWSYPYLREDSSPVDWRLTTFVSVYPEYWEIQVEELPGGSKVTDAHYTLTYSQIEAKLQDEAAEAELVARTNEVLQERGLILYGQSAAAREPLRSVDEILNYVRATLATRQLTKDFRQDLLHAEDPDHLLWLLAIQDALAIKRPARLAGVNTSNLNEDTYLMYLGIDFAARNPQCVDEAAQIVGERIQHLADEDSSDEVMRRRLFGRLAPYTAQHVPTEEVTEQIPEQLMFVYRLAQKFYPEIFEHDYYLSQVKIVSTLPVIKENAEQFEDMLAVLAVARASQEGKSKYIFEGITLMRGVLRGLDAIYGDKTSAAQIEKLLEHIARTRDAIGYQTVIKLAEQIPSTADEQYSHRKLNPQNLADLPQAIVKILSSVREPVIEQGDDEDVFDFASQTAVVLAELGVDTKLKQAPLTMWDIAARYPKLPNDKLRDMIELMETRRGETSVQKVYQELKARNRNRPHFTKWEPGSGILS